VWITEKGGSGAGWGQTSLRVFLKDEANNIIYKKSDILTFSSGTVTSNTQLVILEGKVLENSILRVHYEIISTGSGNTKVNDTDPDILTIKVIEPIIVDHDAPTISLINKISGLFKKESLPLSFDISLDEESEVFVNGVSQGKYKVGIHSLTLPESQEGNNLVNVYATDEAGNDSSIQSFSYTYDSVEPVITINNPISGFYNEESLPKNFKFSLDETSEVFVNGIYKGDFTTGTHTLALPVPIIEGNNSVTITAKDIVGNESNQESFTYFYDSINPIVTATANLIPNSYGWYKQDVIVNFNANDGNGSGINTVSDPVTVSTEGINTITGNATVLIWLVTLVVIAFQLALIKLLLPYILI
jgi:hypothetical protein